MRRDHARRARRRRARASGTSPTRPARCRSTCTPPTPTSPIGCGYKYLNGGPGAPAFVWAHPRHTARMDREQLRQPLSGWLGHAAPFEFAPAYRPAGGIARFVCGTPPVLAMAALECGLDVFAVAEARGGMAALRAKSIALAELFIDRVEARCAGLGLTLVTPRDAQRARQPGQLRARRRLPRHAGADRARRDRRLPRRRPPARPARRARAAMRRPAALRLHAALHALRRRLGRAPSSSPTCWRAANTATARFAPARRGD